MKSPERTSVLSGARGPLGCGSGRGDLSCRGELLTGHLFDGLVLEVFGALFEGDRVLVFDVDGLVGDEDRVEGNLAAGTTNDVVTHPLGVARQFLQDHHVGTNLVLDGGADDLVAQLLTSAGDGADDGGDDDQQERRELD